MNIAELLCATIKCHSFSVGIVEWSCSAIASIVDRNTDNQMLFIFGNSPPVPPLLSSSSSSAFPSTSTSFSNMRISMDDSYHNNNSTHSRPDEPMMLERKTRKNSSISIEKQPSTVELLITALSSHKTNSTVIVQVLRAIRFLSLDQKNIQLRFSEENIVLIVLKLLKIHKSTDLICEYCGWMIYNFGVSSVLSPASISANLANIQNEKDNKNNKENKNTSNNNNEISIISSFNKISTNEPKNILINREIVYTDLNNWSLIVSCMEMHLSKGMNIFYVHNLFFFEFVVVII